MMKKDKLLNTLIDNIQSITEVESDIYNYVNNLEEIEWRIKDILHYLEVTPISRSGAIVLMEELQKLEELNNLLTSALSEYKKRGQDYAKAYKNYRILVAQELLRLRDSGVPVTICHDLARGKVEVANAKEQEIIAESLYNSCKEAILTYKLQIKILQAQINNDYGNGGN